MTVARALLLPLCLALATDRVAAQDVAYSFQLSALAQRYYGLCRADARVQEQIARDLNERQLPVPPLHSALESLPVANRREAELVCLGAAAQRLDDLQSPPVALLPPAPGAVAAVPDGRATRADRPLPTQASPPAARPVRVVTVVPQATPARARTGPRKRAPEAHRIEPAAPATQPVAAAAPPVVPLPPAGSRITVRLEPPKAFGP